MTRSHFYLGDPAAPAPTQPRRMGVLALIFRGDGLLLERRSDAPLWSLIGGSVDDGETLGQALCREVREETALVVRDYSLYSTFSDPSRIVSYPDGTVFSVAAFAYHVSVQSFDGMRASAESEALRFFELPELARLALPATQQPIFDCLLAGDAPPILR